MRCSQPPQAKHTEGGFSASSSLSSPSPSPLSPGTELPGAGTTTFPVLASMISPFGPAIWPRILEGFGGSPGLARVALGPSGSRERRQQRRARRGKL